MACNAFCRSWILGNWERARQDNRGIKFLLRPNNLLSFAWVRACEIEKILNFALSVFKTNFNFFGSLTLLQIGHVGLYIWPELGFGRLFFTYPTPSGGPIVFPLTLQRYSNPQPTGWWRRCSTTRASLSCQLWKIWTLEIWTLCSVD